MTEHLQEEIEGGKNSLWLRSAIASLLILLFGFGLAKAITLIKRKPKKRSHHSRFTVKVRTVKAKYRSYWLKLRGYGTARAEKVLDIVPELNGKVVYAIRPFKVGVIVRKHQKLIEIDRRLLLLEYKRLKAQIAALQRQLNLAERALSLHRRNLERSKKLLKRGALDPGTFERQEQLYLDRSQRVESLKQALATNKILLKRVEIQLSKAVIRAPFAAKISRGELTVGTFVAAGRPIARIESIDAVEIPVGFTLEQLKTIKYRSLSEIPELLKKYPPVRVSFDHFSWSGRVIRIGAGVDFKTRTLTLFVRVSLKDSRNKGTLLPGTFCRVEIPVRFFERIAILPKSSIYRENTVFVVSEGRLSPRKVKVELIQGEKVFISDGLRDGEEVVISKLADPIPGAPVSISR